MDQFDLIIIGGGPAGYNAAEKAAERGLNTLIIEKNRLGGTCLNEGCIPAKVFVNAARIYEQSLDSITYGVKGEKAEISHADVVARKNAVVNQLVSGVSAKLKKANVSVVNATGRIERHAESGFVVKADDNEYFGKTVLIATGAKAQIPDIPGLNDAYDQGFVVTNHEMFDLLNPPQKLVIIGGGVIGIEMSRYYSAAGSEVTLIEALDHIGGNNEPEIAAQLKEELEKKVCVYTGCNITKINQSSVVFIDESGQTVSVRAEKVICAIGRKPNTDSIGLEKLGVYIENGAIVTDDKMRTNIPGVYAAGDVNGKSMLASTAYREGEVAINNILGNKDLMDYKCIPNLIYSSPEIASVGYTESAARSAGLHVHTVKITMMMSGRYLVENKGGKGFCKVVIDTDKNTVIGMHLIGGYAAENIYAASLMIGSEMNINKIKKIVFPHPTDVEVYREALV